MQSVPPRGSGWVRSDCRFSIADFDWPVSIESIKNLKSAIGNHETHPLPRGGTDFMTHDRVMPEVSESQSELALNDRAGESINWFSMSIGLRK